MRRGWIVRVDFLDHVQGGSDPLAFVVYGELSKITPTCICVDSWAYADKARRTDANEQRYTIVRSAITKITRLTEAGQ